MVSIIEQISADIPYDPEQVVGYSECEIEKIERLYDIVLGGTLKQFMLEMGRSDGGLIGDDPIIIYRPTMTVRGFILMQSGIQEDIYNAGLHEIASKKPFVFSIESETQYFFVATKSDDPDRVYHYNENSETVDDTGHSFLEYMKRTVRVWGKRCNVICCGELLVV
jgi:hypothetical protein